MDTRWLGGWGTFSRSTAAADVGQPAAASASAACALSPGSSCPWSSTHPMEVGGPKYGGGVSRAMRSWCDLSSCAACKAKFLNLCFTIFCIEL